MLVETRTNNSLSLEELAQDTSKLGKVWEKLTAESCPFHYNFHLHTNCSDGQLTPELLIQQAISIGLKGLAITDHHETKGFWRACQYLEQQQASAQGKLLLPHLWTGIEITSVLNGTNVHILGYGFDPQNESLQKYLTGKSPKGKLALAKNVINTLHQAGALVVLAHPFRYRRSAQELIPEAFALGIDGIEAYYGYGNTKPWIPSSERTLIAKQLAKKYDLYSTCGTDTHGSNILFRV